LLLYNPQENAGVSRLRWVRHT